MLFRYLCTSYSTAIINENLKDIQYSPIRDHKYANYFNEVQYNGKTLSDAERKKFVNVINETIALYTDALPIVYDVLKNSKDQYSEYHKIDYTVVSVMQFVFITMIDGMVASKYFILADTDYEKRFMRGKLKVIINEGFKKLYGFEKTTHEKSMWDSLLPILNRFSEEINLRYQELTFLLEKQANSSSWWKKERDLETHMDTEELYLYRMEEVIESKVIIDFSSLFSTLLAVEDYLWEMHTCIYKYLALKLQKGELTE